MKQALTCLLIFLTTALSPVAQQQGATILSKEKGRPRIEAALCLLLSAFCFKLFREAHLPKHEGVIKSHFTQVIVTAR